MEKKKSTKSKTDFPYCFYALWPYWQDSDALVYKYFQFPTQKMIFFFFFFNVLTDQLLLLIEIIVYNIQ